MDRLFWSTECVGIGECGLDRTRSQPAKQQEAFKRQILAAKLTGKSLVLHLHGATPQQDDEVNMGVLGILIKTCPPRWYPIYLHWFVASWNVYMAWAHHYNKLLLGINLQVGTGTGFRESGLQLTGRETGTREWCAKNLCPSHGHVNHPCWSIIRLEWSLGSGSCPPSSSCLVLASTFAVFPHLVPTFSYQLPGTWICSRVLMENRCKWIKAVTFSFSCPEQISAAGCSIRICGNIKWVVIAQSRLLQKYNQWISQLGDIVFAWLPRAGFCKMVIN